MYERLCKFIAKKLSKIIDEDKFEKRIRKNISNEFIEAINFAGMDLKPHEIMLFSYFSSFILLIIAILIDIAMLSFYDFSFEKMGIFTIFLMLAITLAFPFLAMHFISEYLKLNPNLENSIRFAARESKTSLGKDLKKLIWDLEIRIYKSIDDAITYFANVWGRWSDYLKRALHLIRSSVHENETERKVTLDRSLDVVLDGAEASMLDFAQKLHQPTITLYSIGIMIPLALISMVPAIAIIGFKLSIFQIFLIYDIVLPIFVFIYIRKILLIRPATFNPPAIPEEHPEIKKVNKKMNFLLALLIAITIFIIGLFLSNKIISYAFFILWGLATFISIYCIRTYSPYKKLRDEIKQMENEFSDSLYILGKRIMEGKAAEEAFSYASKVAKGSKMEKIFSETTHNLAMRMSIKEALFDEKLGSLKHVYSDRIRAIMKLFVEGIKKSYDIASITIIKIADHLKQLQEVESKIKNALGILTSTLRSTCMVFAPLIAGVTLGIAKLVSNVFEKMNMGEIFEASLFFGSPNFAIENIKHEYFIAVVGIYIIQLVFLLIRFANGIDEGDDRIQYMYMLGRAMPTAIFIFSISTIISMIIFGGIA